jgi:hypothetical protein
LGARNFTAGEKKGTAEDRENFGRGSKNLTRLTAKAKNLRRNLRVECRIKKLERLRSSENSSIGIEKVMGEERGTRGVEVCPTAATTGDIWNEWRIRLISKSSTQYKNGLILIRTSDILINSNRIELH